MRWNLTLDELENMIPFEREIYISLVMQEIEKKNKK